MVDIYSRGKGGGIKVDCSPPYHPTKNSSSSFCLLVDDSPCLLQEAKH